MAERFLVFRLPVNLHNNDPRISRVQLGENIPATRFHASHGNLEEKRQSACEEMPNEDIMSLIVRGA